MGRNLKRSVLVMALVVVLVMAVGGVVSAAPPWSDVDAALLTGYGLTESDLQAISSGYPDETWKPNADMLRRHFVKMAVDAYDIATANPATPTFSDVAADDTYYPYIEGAVAAGLIQGVGGGKFAPDATVTRQQGAAIIARYVAVQKSVDLQSAYTDAQAAAALAAFSDAGHVSSQLLKEMAFAVEQGILKGSGGMLNPQARLLRIQGAALIVRSLDVLVPPKDIVDTAVADGRFTTLVGALQSTGLDTALKGAGPFTVFAPTDTAFAALPEGLLAGLTTQQLTDILLYHVVSGKVLAADVVGLDGDFVDTLLTGQQVLVSVDDGVKINTANVVITDIVCSNGVIHVIDAVLVPPKDIVDTAVADGRFTTLVGALQSTGLDTALKGAGPFTVFAPTDAAFAALPEGLLAGLTTEQLTDILLYHVVNGKVLAADVVGLDGKFVDTLLTGQQVLVSVDDGVKINTANVVITDIVCSNGVIHVIDAVLVPPAD